jgi:hypothetical protein
MEEEEGWREEQNPSPQDKVSCPIPVTEEKEGKCTCGNPTDNASVVHHVLSKPVK